MIQRWMTQPSVIGLDIGRSAIKAVQLRPSDKGPAVEGRLLIERSSGGANPTPAEAERLSRAMDRRGMSATRVVMVAPSDALVAASVDVPPMDSKVPRDKIVEMELCRTQRLTPGTFELAWWDLPKSASGATITQAHALALPHNAIEETLEILAGIDLNVIRTVSGSMAHSALAQRHPIDPRCISAVLDLGTTQGHLSLMYAGRVVHERGLPDFNPLDVRRQFASTLGIDEPTAKRAIGRYGISDEPSGSVACVSASLLGEALGPFAEEIGMSFAYVSHLYPQAELGQLLLAGGGANVPGIDASLAEVLELPVETLNAGSRSRDSFGGPDDAEPACCAAFGAALCAEGL